MERWAANTLRTLGIILTSGFVLVTSLLLLLLSMCAAQGGFGGTKHPEQAVPYLAAAVAVLVAGIWFIVWLARGIFRSSAILELSAAGAPAGVIPSTEFAEANSSLPLHLSPSGRKAIDRLVLALGAQILLSAIVLIFNQLHFWSAPRIFAPFPAHNWPLVVFAPFVLYHIPYAILIYALLKRPDRRAFTYSLAVPAVLIMQALFSLGYFALFATQHPVAMILLFVPWAIHILIIAFAYQAIQQVGLHPKPSSLIVAAIAAFVYFSAIHTVSTFLLRFMRL
jgi:hypothetical protein